MNAGDDNLVTVEILGLPVRVHERAQAHNDELTREFRLLAEQLRGQPDAHVPRRLIELTDDLTATYGMFTEEQEDALDAAVARGEETIDLRYVVPAHVGDAATALGAMLDDVDEFCRQGDHLLTLATPPDAVAYRRWFLDEFARQAEGLPPTPWAESPYAAALSDAS